MEDKPQYTTMSGCFLRVAWAMIGPTLVFAGGILIIANNSGYGSFPDFVLLAGVLISLGARFLDPGVVDPTRNDGDIGNVTPRKYALWMLVGSGLVFVISHVVASLVK